MNNRRITAFGLKSYRHLPENSRILYPGLHYEPDFSTGFEEKIILLFAAGTIRVLQLKEEQVAEPVRTWSGPVSVGTRGCIYGVTWPDCTCMVACQLAYPVWDTTTTCDPGWTDGTVRGVIPIYALSTYTSAPVGFEFTVIVPVPGAEVGYWVGETDSCWLTVVVFPDST